MTFKPFTSIEAYRNVVRSVKKFCAEHNKPLPVLEYTGTVKLHGTSSGQYITPNKVQPIKRTSIIDIGCDNAGFAMFCHGKEDRFREIAQTAGFTHFTLYGEWCGGNIQKGVAIAQLEKHFVAFSGYDHVAEKHISISDITKNMDDVIFRDYNDHGIWFVNQIPTYSITIDFSKPEDCLAQLDELTLAVEKECPWGKFRGVSGVGEGIVWQPVDPQYSFVTDLWFKTKGLEHKKTNVSTGTKTEASPERLATIRDVVDAVLPQWRLEQFITEMKNEGLEIIPENTGKYLQLVAKDVIKECADILAENELDWKTAQKYIMPQIRQYYMKLIDQEAFEEPHD